MFRRVLQYVLAGSLALLAAPALGGGAPRMSFADALGSLEARHRAAVDARLTAAGPEARADLEAAAERAGIPVNQLVFSQGAGGVLRHLSGLDVRLPMAEADPGDPVAVANAFLGEAASLTRNPAASFVLRRVNTSLSGVAHVRFHQVLAGHRVFGAEVIVHVNPDGTVRGVAGHYLPPAVAGDAGGAGDVLALWPYEGPVVDAELGWYHPALHGEPGEAEPASAALAWRTLHSDPVEGSVEAFLDARDGTVLLERGVTDYNELKTIQWANDLPDPIGQLVYRDDPPACGQGVWPTCTWYPGTSLWMWVWTDWTYNYYASDHARDSWDNGLGAGACVSPDYHRMRATADYEVHPYYNGAWDLTAGGQPFCGIKVGRARACLDVVSHEFTHGVDYAESDLSGAGGHHGAMNEGFPDVFGEFVESSIYDGADWVHGTLGNCQSTRDLADPASSFWYDENEQRVARPQPDHASNYDEAMSNHYNSTIVSKMGYLMSRPAASPAVPHWGIPVEGIDEDNAATLWYDVLANAVTSTETFSDLREDLVDSAAAHFGLNSDYYWRTSHATWAAGFWGNQVGFGFVTADPPAAAYYSVNGQGYRWVFYRNAADDLVYRNRTCLYWGACNWSAETTLGSGATGAYSGVDAVLWNNELWVFREGAANSVRYTVLRGDGTSTTYTRTGATTSDMPAVAVVGIRNYMLNRAPGVNYEGRSVSLYYRTSGTIWNGPYATPINTRTAVRAVADGSTLYVFYSTADAAYEGQLVYRTYDGTTWSAERTLPANPHPSVYAGAPGAVRDRGRLHVTTTDGLGTNQTVYASCALPCDDLGDWTHLTKLDYLDAATDWVYLSEVGPSDGRLYQFRYTDDPDALMTWRWKNSE